MSLDGKVALITGGARGLGKEVASALLGRGCKVALVDFRKDVGEKAAEELRTKGSCKFFQCDVMHEDQMVQTFEAVERELGPLDIVCNNAGINNMLNDGLKNWKGMLGVNLGAVIQGTELARDTFRASGRGGVIINTASIAGMIAAPSRDTVYSATKWGVVGFTRSLQYWRKQTPPICVACVCPTLILTDGGRLTLEAAKRTNQKTTDPGVEPSKVANLILRLIAGDLMEEAVAVIGPLGVKLDRTYHDVVYPEYSKKMYQASL